jgi:ketosteroid isomerase-like protein
MKMNRRRVFNIGAIAALGLTLLTGNGVAQQAIDIDGVKAASKAFYEALAILDDGTAMEKVWVRAPYTTYAGPFNKSVTVGSEALKKMWAENNKPFEKRNISITDAYIYSNGNLAWEMGTETGESKRKDSPAATNSNLVTNVYEKVGGRWLMVSHHAQRIVQ